MSSVMNLTICSGLTHDLQWIEIQSLQNVTKEESMLRMASKWAFFVKNSRF